MESVAAESEVTERAITISASTMPVVAAAVNVASAPAAGSS